MEIKDQVKFAQHIFRLLKVNEIVFPIGRTNKGNLGLKFSQNSDEYEIMLDAVPLSTKSMLEDDNNIELKKMVEKFWFKDSIHSSFATYGGNLMAVEDTGDLPNGLVSLTEFKSDSPGTELKKRGRPAGSKNHVKKPNTEAA